MFKRKKPERLGAEPDCVKVKVNVEIKLPVKGLTTMLKGVLKTAFSRPSLVLVSVIATATAQFLPPNLRQILPELNVSPQLEKSEHNSSL
jgi:hypothetical protein